MVRNFSKEKLESAASVTRVALRQAGQDSSCERLCSGILMATAAVLGESALRHVSCAEKIGFPQIAG